MAAVRVGWITGVIRRLGRPGRAARWLAIATSAVLMAGVAVVATTAPEAKPAAAALTSNLNTSTLKVADAETGAAITTFQYLINEDNTGTTGQRSPADGCQPGVANYPASCKWTSMGINSEAPVVTQGDQSDFGGSGITLPSGRYLISVLADGHKIDGAHFTVPFESAAPIKVLMAPTPIKTATLQAAVFKDISPVNSAPDLPAEPGLAGFKGGLLDYLGDVTTDVFGNPLCTVYELGTDGKPDPEQPVANTGGNCFSFCYVVDNGIDVGIVDPVGADGTCPTDATTITGNVMKPTPDTPPSAAGGFPRAVPATAAIEGKIKIPNLGTNRYAASLIAPNGSSWVQTTTLEGNHDWDAWLMEGATGLDTELAVAGEPFPNIFFGYTPASVDTINTATVTGKVKGVVDAVKVYVPATGGTTQAGQIWGGLNGGRIDKPINRPWVALTDLTNGDTAVYVGRGNADGTFQIDNVPDGDYSLSWWDDPQDYIFDLQNVSVVNGQVVDMGVLPLTGWWTEYRGFVFNDTNRNGKMDWTDANSNGCPDPGEGEQGVPNYTLTMRKRENSLMDRGTTTVGTDACGRYYFEAGYPMTQWLVMEAYNDLYYTTGVTYQADNQPTPTTVKGAGVDISTLPIIGLGGKVDWGVHSYDARGTNGIDPQNGGIVGTVSYDTTRNELDPRYAAVEDWQPGVPGMKVELHTPESCLDPLGDPLPGVTCDATGQYQLNADGSYKLGKLVNTYVTETWEKPSSDCVPRDVNGVRQVGQQITANDGDCLEAPLMGVQFGTYATDQGTPDANFGAAVNGNYGFGDGCFDGTLDDTDPANPVCTGGTFTPLPGATDYLVKVVVPNDRLNRKPQYKFTREEDINIGNGDAIVPQVPPPACAGALHTVDVAGQGTDGANATVNPTFVDIGGSPYEGQAKPLCDVKLVGLANGRSIVPTFNVFTDVPLPGRYWGLIIDDLTFSTDTHQINYGEKAGVRFSPIGIYDSTDRLVYTTESDYSGFFDVLMPSTNRISCPTPSGVCAGVYRFVGNDPGVPGRLNPNYNPGYRTIAAEFETFPGLITPADLAPTQVGVTVQLPNGQFTQTRCDPDVNRPQLFAVNRPFVANNTTAGSFTITGVNFGSLTGKVLLDGTTSLPTTAWSDTSITVTVPAGTTVGARQLSVTSAAGLTTVEGLTFHVLGNGYNPRVFEVGPPSSASASPIPARYQPANTIGDVPPVANHAIQNAVDDASAFIGQNNSNRALVVVYPGVATPTNSRLNPQGAYYENLVLNAPVILQGVGPGGFQGTTYVQGTILDGSAYGGDSPIATDWATLVNGLIANNSFDSPNPTINDGAVITMLGCQNGNSAFTSTKPARVDGFDIRGGNQFGFPANINQIGGGATGVPAVVQTQGGAIYANAYIRNLQITNNTVEHNGGAYGAIRLGTPNVGDNSNGNVRIAFNRIVSNAGTNLAGAIGIFRGGDGYRIDHNDLCGNFSAEDGGAISVFGQSGTSTTDNNIDHNRIWLNQSYDEGGAVMIAGELPNNPSQLSPGSGPVKIHENLIQQNLGNDDGGGIRFLMAGNFPMDVFNNMITNNVSTHEGGGVAVDDAPDVRFYNNTVAGNMTTATALTSNGRPAPAGYSTALNSTQLQATLPSTINGQPRQNWSKPTVFKNNIFWDNRAGTKAGPGVSTPGGVLVTGLGQTPDTTPVDRWDFGRLDGTPTLAADQFTPVNSVIQTSPTATGRQWVSSATNSNVDPVFSVPYTNQVSFEPWRTNPNFVGAILLSVNGAGTREGDYHLKFTTGSAVARGNTGAPFPSTDLDGDPRPGGGGIEAGADELPTTFNVAVTKTDGVTTVLSGSRVTYTIGITNIAGNGAVGPIALNDNASGLSATGISWTCTATGGSTCSAASGTGVPTTQTVNLGGAFGASVTYTATATVSATSGNVTNTVTVSPPGGDTNAADNTATDIDTVQLPVDVGITKADGRTTLFPGQISTYTMVVGKAAATTQNVPVTVNDPAPANASILSWTCAAANGASCNTASGNGALANVAGTLGTAANSSLTYTVRAQASATAAASSTVANLATVTVASPWFDTNNANNAATDTDTVAGTAPALPTFTTLDTFPTTVLGGVLSSSWQVPLLTTTVTSTGLAQALSTTNAFWNGTGSTFGTSQGAALTLSNSIVNGTGVILKASGTYNGLTGQYTNYIRVTYNAGLMTVESTTNSGSTFTTAGTIPTGGNLASGNTITARADAAGNVYVWKTVGTTTTYLGGLATTFPGANTGKVGMRLAGGSAVDNFKGGNV